jgi:formate hydrogenlyase subunit 3/multisubunit Na+/H+ antiporter MnhD subunit
MTDLASLRPLVAVLAPAIAAFLVLAVGDRPSLREGTTFAAALLTLGVVASLVPDALAGNPPTARLWAFVPGVPLAFRADALGLLFAGIAALLWPVAAAYSVGYLRGTDDPAQTRFFAALAASIAAALGVAFAANLLTLFVCYELLTVATYPLVVHRRTEEARLAGRTYAVYAFAGGVAAFAGVVLVYALAGSLAFAPGGLTTLPTADPAAQVALALLVVGFGVKAAIMPLHAWLPEAMVAPTPVSSLLHAVAVVKSGVFGIARVVLFVFGPAAVRESALRWPLAAVAGATMVLAGFLALRQTKLKRLLAYSTVSQLSFIVLGLVVLTPTSVLGALFHFATHAFMKITAFFCAGTAYVETHAESIPEFSGMGRRLPATMTAFTIASVGLVGLPPVGGFVSELYLALGALDGPIPALAAVYWLAALVKLLFFWPVVSAAFFEREEPTERSTTPSWESRSPSSEASWLLVGPLAFTALVAVVLGVVPTATPFFDLAAAVVEVVFG